MKLRAGLVGTLLMLSACTNSNSDSTSPSDGSDTTAASTTVDDEVTTVTPDPESETTTPAPDDPTTEPTTQPTEAPVEIQVGAVLEGESTLEASVIQILPHDFAAQTQGLAWEGPALIESTGAYGSSERRFLSPVSAQTSQEKFLVPELFGTDLTIAGDVGIQLSGREGIATTFDVENLNEIGQIQYDGEGWGICLDGETVVMSDNTETLVRRNPVTLAIVSPQPSPPELTNLRALECAKEWIWAIVGDTNTLVAIEVESGELAGLVDVTDLIPSTAGPDDALSAIAFNPSTETFYVAGRQWGAFYEISIAFPT